MSEIHSPPHKLCHQAWVVKARASLSQHVFHQEVWEGEPLMHKGITSRGELTHGHRRQRFLGWSLLGLWVTDTNNTQGKSLVLHLDVAFTGFFLRPDLFPCRECSSCDHTRASSCACPHSLCVAPLGENRSPASLDPQRHPSTRELCPSAICFNPPKS